MDDRYKIIGEISIPTNKREEFNKYVLQLLMICGIRKVVEVELVGKRYKVTKLPSTDENGFVYFNYSTFENQERSMSYYDTNTCQLYSTDRGYMQFGLVMNLIMAMQEAYSESMCVLMENDEICDVWGYAVCVKQLLGLDLWYKNRAKRWEMILFFREMEYNDITENDVFRCYPYEFTYNSAKELFACLYTHCEIRKPIEYPEDDYYKIDMDSRHGNYYCAYKLLSECVEEEGITSVKFKIKYLLSRDYQKRLKMMEMEQNIRWRRIYEISLYELPPVFIQSIAMIANDEFWDIWNELGGKAYTDAFSDMTRSSVPDTSAMSPLFWKKLKVDKGIGRLETLGTKEYQKFEAVNTLLDSWKLEYHQITDIDVEDINIEVCLADSMDLLVEIWNRHYLSKEFVEEFLEHSKDVEYKKAIFLFCEMINEDARLFPELTRKQALMWVSRKVYDNEKKMRLQAFGDFLSNKEIRKEVFGF